MKKILIYAFLMLNIISIIVQIIITILTGIIHFQMSLKVIMNLETEFLLILEELNSL